MSNRSIKKKEVELNPKYRALFVESKIEQNSNKVRFPEIVKRTLKKERTMRREMKSVGNTPFAKA